MRLDLLHLLRNLRRSPASAVAAILTLSLTLGAGASIFAIVHAVLLTPPPFANPDALVSIGEVPVDDAASAPRAVRYGTFEAWRQRAGSQAAIEAFDGTNLTLTGLGAAERISAIDVTPGFLPLLGVTPALGRTFDREDVGQPVAIVTHRFWRAKLAGDPSAIGREIVLGNRPHTVIGVLPERFAFGLSASDVWRPFPVTPEQAVRDGYRVGALGRLSSGFSAASLGAALDDVSRASAPPARATVTSLEAAMSRDVAGLLAVLAGAAALALLIAFANLAGLLLVRAIDRRRELAVRSALGATSLDIARQLLLEAQALVLLGTAGGLLLAAWMTPLVARLALARVGGAGSRDMTMDWRVVALVAVVASACAWICGALPALTTARDGVADALRRGATPPPRERILRRGFVTAQVALAFVLLVSMAVLGRSLVSILGVNPGFDPRGVLKMQVSLPSATYSSADRVASFYEALQGALEQRLGPGTVSIVDEIPLTGDRGRAVVSVRPGEPGREVVVRAANPGYFDVMRMPIGAGRPFDRSDRAGLPPRAVVSESMARRLFGDESPIGRRIVLTATAQTLEVIGVTGDVKHRALDEVTLPTMYVAGLQSPSHSSIVVVRSTRPEADVVSAVREEVTRLDRQLPVYGVRPMSEVVGASPGVPERQVVTAAFTSFALLAVVLGAVGLFGVVAHDVARRRTELALRIALGADRAHLLGATLGQGALIVGAGLAAGGVLSLWASRALAAVLPGTGSVDALSVGLAAAVLAVAGGAAILPAALRAARTDPLAALRSE